MNFWSRILCFGVAIALGLAAAPPAGAKELIAPPADHLSSDESARLKQAWERDGMPTMQVVVGQVIDGQLVDKGSPLETQLRAAILGQLRTGIDSSRMVDASDLRIAQLQDLQSVATQRGQSLTAALADAMRNNFDSSLVMFIKLIPQPNGQYSVTMDVTDPGSASDLASQGFLNIDANEQIDIINRYACSVAEHFLQQYADRVLSSGGPLYTVRLRVIGINSDDDADDLAEALQGIPGVKGTVEHNWQLVQGSTGYASYTVTYNNPDTGHLRSALRAAVKSQMPGKAFFASLSSRGSMVGSILALQTPQWWLATDRSGHQSQIDAAEAAREKARGLDRKLKVAVVIGQDLDSPAAIAEGGQPPVKIDFDDQTFRDELSNSLSDVGFDAVDTVSLKEAKALVEQQSARFLNQPHLDEALGDKQNFEYLLYGNETTTNGSKRFQFRLVDRRGGMIVATQSWPDESLFDSDPQYHFDPNNPPAAARYIVGKLVTHLDSILSRRLEVDVVVKNVDDVTKVAAIAEIFKNVHNVRSVENFNYSMPVGGFEVVYEGSNDSLMAALAEPIRKQNLPMVVDAFGNSQIVVNLQRKVGPELVMAKPPAPAAPPSQGPNTPDAGSLADKLKVASASVYVVGIGNDGGGFVPVGTAWTVGSDKLATNAHVAEGLDEKLTLFAKQGAKNLHKVARRFDNPNVTLILGDGTVHPAYHAWEKLRSHLDLEEGELTITLFDVALLTVAEGNPGQPLKLASSEEMDSLSPGQPVGYVGFPLEGKSQLWSHPSAVTDVATLAAYTDVFFQSRQKGTPGMLHTTLHILGGASGSPCINSAGEVLGLNSAADMQATVSFSPTVGYKRVVTSPDGKQVTLDDNEVLIASLDKPGRPILEEKDQFMEKLDDGTEIPLSIKNIVKDDPSNMLIDSQGLVLGMVQKNPRINGGFSYAQSIEMLKELLDGSAASKESAREQAWVDEASKLNISPVSK